MLLFILGIRVSELKEITLQQIDDYLNRMPIEITVGKSTSPVKMSYVSSEEARKLLKKHVGEDIDRVKETYGEGRFLVTLSREHLTRRLNSYFVSYGKKVNKNLLSHSSRIAYVTRIVEKFGRGVQLRVKWLAT